ncbi:cyanobacterial porin [Thalassoporum mexicanum PCC 7367]|uniref:iron uptake porin n=1 Tax=Thalassoporum mexicanum TaxID=3457544 RepID=UPI00029F8D8B|nr:iron uptake porin [Pseudanabaena sp. PCC 7367]AFY70769.1 cyanobacterial porin [Pseudanabaena sp. PCC 7367]
MSKLLNKLTAGSLLVAAALTAQSAKAAELETELEVNQSAPQLLAQNYDASVLDSISRDALVPAATQTAQVTSVSQLTDVQPTDWAFTALQSLVERYGCIAGYPDRTYRGQRAMTRYEFAAGLNACLDKINEIISSGLADKVSKEDLAALQRLQEEFAAELAALRGRVDALEAKTAQLEAQQFSTTTKLAGRAILALSGAAGADDLADTNVTFSGRVRLNFNTSFTGRDRLTTRLQAGNVTRFNQATDMTRLGFDTNTGNTFELDNLWYRFPVGERITAYFGIGLDSDDVFGVLNPFLASSDSGAISRFGRRDPFMFRAPEGAGAGVNFQINEKFAINAFYLGDKDESADPEAGITGGSYGAGVQLLFEPNDKLQLALAYKHAYESEGNVNLTSSTGSEFSQDPFGDRPTESDRYAFYMNWRVSQGFNFGGWVSFISANTAGSTLNGSADLINWMAHFSFPDLFMEGSTGAILFGQPPRVTSFSGPAVTPNEGTDDDTSYHLEALYRWKLSKHISITPGVLVIFNPQHNEERSTAYVGTIRTTFSF